MFSFKFPPRLARRDIAVDKTHETESSRPAENGEYEPL